MEKVLENTGLIIVGCECPDSGAACRVIPAATIKEALQITTTNLGSACDVLIVPHAKPTLPIFQEIHSC